MHVGDTKGVQKFDLSVCVLADLCGSLILALLLLFLSNRHVKFRIFKYIYSKCYSLLTRETFRQLLGMKIADIF